MTDGNNRFLGNRALSPETLMMGYGYDPFLSERSLKPPVFNVAKRVNHRGCCEIQRDADSPLERNGFELGSATHHAAQDRPFRDGSVHDTARRWTHSGLTPTFKGTGI